MQTSAFDPHQLRGKQSYVHNIGGLKIKLHTTKNVATRRTEGESRRNGKAHRDQASSVSALEFCHYTEGRCLASIVT